MEHATQINGVAVLLTTVGALFLIGMLTDFLGRRTALPRVTLLLIFGILIGPAALDLLPPIVETLFPAFTNIALVMVGFLLGEKLTLVRFNSHGRAVMWMSLAVVLGTALAIFIGGLLLGLPIELALLLAGIAPATDPAATADVVHEARDDSPFARTLIGIVAVDDVWGLILFSVLLAAAQSLHGDGDITGILLTGSWELFGALVLGIGLGIPMALLTGRLQPGEPTLMEALGLVLLCGGLALTLHVSFLLAAMTMGAVVSNIARHHTRPFHAIENIEWPFMVLFFVLAGASLNFDSLLKAGSVGIAYILLRMVGRVTATWLCSGPAGMSRREGMWMGIALMPQAGVALGMVLVAVQAFPELSATMLPVVIGATVLFEIIGPVLTRMSLGRVGKASTHQD